MRMRSPPLEFASNASNINSLQSRQVVTSGLDSEWVKRLGHTSSLETCGAACVAWRDTRRHHTDDRCRSFTRYNEYPFNASLSGLCFGHVDAAWLPLDAPGIDAGTVAWPCATGLDCSLNGKCASGVCTCNTGWTGRRCGTLSLAPARRPRGPWLQPDARRSEHELVGRGRGAG